MRIKNFATYSEGQLAENLLKGQGIKSVLQRGDSAAAAEFSGYVGEVDLFVLRNDFERAKNILDDFNTDIISGRNS